MYACYMKNLCLRVKKKPETHKDFRLNGMDKTGRLIGRLHANNRGTVTVVSGHTDRDGCYKGFFIG